MRLIAPDKFVEIFAKDIQNGRVHECAQEEQTSQRQVQLCKDWIHPHMALAVYDMNPVTVKTNPRHYLSIPT